MTFYIQIPKTGCNSIRGFHLPYAGISALNVRNLDKEKFGMAGGWWHLTARELRATFPEHYMTSRAFAFIRNPYSRTVSEFSWRCKLLNIKATPEGFQVYLDRLDEGDGQYLLKNKDWKRHIIPQMDYLTDDDGFLIVKHVGKVEQIQQDYDLFCEKLNLPHRNIPHENSSERKTHWQDFYNDKRKKQVIQRYGVDLEFGKYTFN